MNSRRYTVASITIAFMAVTLLSVPGFGGSAYAVGVGMSISADANAGSHSIMISGTTDRSNDVVIIVTAPNGNRVSVDQVTPSSNSYSATIGIGGNQYNQDGMYTIVASHSIGEFNTANTGHQLITASTEVEIADGHVIPEFGTIAVMILVVAIVAIVAVSAKSRLSLVQRF